jgi:uncharacterized protein YkwD
MKHATTLLAAALLAVTVAFGAFALDSGEVQAADTVNVRTCTGGKIALKADEKRMLDLHNQKRRSQELRRLCVHPALQRAARDHSQDMIRKDYFAHGNVGRRLKRHGYNWSRYAENIAPDPGSPSPGPTFDTWMDSQSHRNNIMNRRFREVGIGLATGTHKGERKTMWTADFGNRR